MNVTRDLQDAIADRSMMYDLDLVAVDLEFRGFVKRIRKFDEELKIFEKESEDWIYFFIL